MRRESRDAAAALHEVLHVARDGRMRRLVPLAQVHDAASGEYTQPRFTSTARPPLSGMQRRENLHARRAVVRASAQHDLVIEIVCPVNDRSPPVRTRAVRREPRERHRRRFQPRGERRVARTPLVQPVQLPHAQPRKRQRGDDRENGGKHVASLHSEKITAGEERGSEKADLLAQVVRVHRRLSEESLQLTRRMRASVRRNDCSRSHTRPSLSG